MKKFLTSLSILIFAPIFFASTASASQIYLSSTSTSVHAGERIAVRVYLETEGDNINAVEGHLNYSSSMLAVDSIFFGNSILSFWPESPHKASDGVVSFSGVAPGGYNSSSKGLLFTVVFKARAEGAAELSLSNMLALLDDGQGTKSNLSIKNTSLAISKANPTVPESESSKSLSVESTVLEDTEAPETFIPLIGKNPDIFNGKSFLVFTTTDKQSGVDHYEVQEARYNIVFDKSWAIVTSPHLLSDQNLHSYVYVRAYDKAGNFRTEILSPLYPVSFYQSAVFWVIILGVIFLLVFIYKKKINEWFVIYGHEVTKCVNDDICFIKENSLLDNLF